VVAKMSFSILFLWIAMLAGQQGNVATQNVLHSRFENGYPDGIYRCFNQVCTYLRPLVGGDVLEDGAFDVPPREWDDTVPITGGVNNLLPFYTRHVVECSDKSRFKMMSEDGKWHCLKLVN
jgi:hypothetical protein